MKKDDKKESKAKKERCSFQLPVDLIADLNDISKDFHINKNTIVAMAICKGADRIHLGYIPKTNNTILAQYRKTSTKEQIYELPSNIWNLLKTSEENLNKYLGKKLPINYLLSFFLQVEITKFIKLQKDYANRIEKEENFSLSTSKSTKSFYIDKWINELCNELNISRTQVINYFLATGIVYTYFNEDYDTVEILENDSDLYNWICTLELKPPKNVYTLLQALSKNNRITWNSVIFKNLGK